LELAALQSCECDFLIYSSERLNALTIRIRDNLKLWLLLTNGVLLPEASPGRAFLHASDASPAMARWRLRRKRHA